MSEAVGKTLFQFTPLREGRRAYNSCELIFQYFNSRPSARGDRNSAPAIAIVQRFQFTPLREGRRSSWHLHRRRGHFNSRPSARGDESYNNRCKTASIISIHAPPRGATPCLLFLGGRMNISIHAPPRGATVLSCSLPQPPCISIHAPPRGATMLHRMLRGI